MRRPGKTFRGVLLLGKAGLPQPSPTVSQPHPESSPQANLCGPPRSSRRTVLHTHRENQVASIDWTPHSSHSPSKVKADTSLLVRTKQKVSQDLASQGQLTGRCAGP